MMTGMTKHFIFHIRWISILRFLYINSFSASFCTTFLSDGIATSINKQILSLFLIITVWPVCQKLSIRLYPLIP
jgi:hypothetical protein